MPIFAAFEETSIGGRGAGTAEAVVAASWGAESVLCNPAGIFTNSGRISFASSMCRFYELKDLQAGTAAIAYGRSQLAVGAAAVALGNPLYRETQLAAAAACRFKRFDLTLGAAVRYGELAVRNYGRASAFMIDVGVQAALTSFLSWGAAATNVNGAVIGRSSEPLPRSMRLGWTFRPRQGVELGTELNKDDRFPLDIRWGITYRPLDVLTFRAGSANQPRRWSLGFSIHIGTLRIDYAFTNHVELGATHLVGLGRE